MTDKNLEKLVDLKRRGLRLLQSWGLGFTTDAYGLADFVGPRPDCRRIGDLGSGNGGLTLLLWAHMPEAELIGLEIRPELVELARRNLELNRDVAGLAEHCRFVLGDWRQQDGLAAEGFAPASFDLLVSNPPYWPLGAGRMSPDPLRAAACFELNGTLGELLTAAWGLLREGGSLALILPCGRELEVRRQVGWQLIRREPASGNRTLLELVKAGKSNKQ